MAVIGPLLLPRASRYVARYMEATFPPSQGMMTTVHRHSGPEAWYMLSGAQCLRTPENTIVLRSGEGGLVPPGPPMVLTSIGPETRRDLFLVLHDTSEPCRRTPTSGHRRVSVRRASRWLVNFLETLRATVEAPHLRGCVVGLNTWTRRNQLISRVSNSASSGPSTAAKRADAECPGWAVQEVEPVSNLSAANPDGCQGGRSRSLVIPRSPRQKSAVEDQEVTNPC